MRRSDVVEVGVITRRHVGGILSVNKTELNAENLTIFVPRLFIDRELPRLHNSTHSRE